MASPTKSTITRAERSSLKMSFDSLVKNKNKIKVESFSVTLPPKNQKRKSPTTIDLSVPKKTTTIPPTEAKTIVFASNISPPPKAPKDFDSVSSVVMEYLQLGKSHIDEALIRAAEAERRVSYIEAHLSVMEEKASKASKLEEELSWVKAKLQESKGKLTSKNDALTLVEVKLSDVQSQYTNLQQSQASMSKTYAEIAMDLATYFGQKARLELFEAFFAGRHLD